MKRQSKLIERAYGENEELEQRRVGERTGRVHRECELSGRAGAQAFTYKCKRICGCVRMCRYASSLTLTHTHTYCCADDDLLSFELLLALALAFVQ